MKILYLEDNLTDFELVKSMVEDEIEDVNFVHAVSKGNFEKAIKENNLDLILCDFNLPGFDGLSALKLKNQFLPDVPFIFVSGTIGEDIAVESLKSGATDYILKSNLNRLLPAIIRALKEKEEKAKLKIAENRVAESEKKFRALVENSTDLTYIMDENSVIKYANPSVKNILGYDEDELIGKVGMELIHPDDRPSSLQALSAVLKPEKNENKNKELSYRIKHKNGKYIHFSGRAQNLLDKPEVKAIVVNARNITEEMIAKKEIRRIAKFPSENPNPVLRLDENGTLYYYNTASDQILEFYQKKYNKPFPVTWNKIIKESLNSNKKEIIEDKINGKYFSFLFVPIQKENYVNIYGENITERKLKEIELKSSEEKFRSLYETMVQGVVYQNSDGSIIECNPAAERILGLSFAQMQGRKSVDPRWQAVKEDCSDFPGEEHPSMVALRTGKKIEDVVMGVYNPQLEKYVWININAVPQFNHGEDKPYQVYTTFEDITEEKEALEEIKNSERRLRILIDNAPDAIFIYDLEGNIIELNSTGEQITGFKRSEIIGNNLFKLGMIKPEEMEKAYENFEKTIKGEAVYTKQYKMNSKSGKDIELEISSFPITVQGENQVLSIARDISARKEFERKLIEAKEYAEEMNQLKSVFLANMSHELRTPLIGMYGYAELLKEELVDPEHVEMVETILESSDRLKNTVNSLLNLSKIEEDQVELKEEDFNLPDLIKSVSKNFVSAASEKGLNLSTTIKNDNLFVKLDRSLLNLILKNIVDNSIKYTNEGSVNIILSSFSENNCKFAVIEVNDTGIGIPENRLKRIFEPFRQASEGYSRMYEGTGLGLTLTKKYVDLLNGEIFVDSKEGIGSTFTVKIPTDNK